MSSPDIEIIYQSNDQIKVRIPKEDGEIWEKADYFPETPIYNLLNDFKKETNLGFPTEKLLQLRNIKELNEEYKIKNFINKYEEKKESDEEEKKGIDLGDNEILAFPEIIAKPFSDPFCIFGYIKKEKTVKKIKIGRDDMLNELEEYGPFSAYCNGNNFLFISGGEKKNGEYLEKFWIIDLKNNGIEVIDMIPKKNHSMIYLPGDYVFVVGGQDKETFYYDKKINRLFGWKPLNNNRIEPALILVGDILYCFDNVNSKNKINNFNFEKTDLRSSDHLWQLCQPKMPDIPMNQKFFGIAKNEDDLIFIGGNMDIDENDNEEHEKKNFKYNTTEGTIEESNVPFIECNLKEKTLLPYNNKISYIFPDCNKHHPEMIFYLREKNAIRIVKYKSTNELKEEQNAKDKIIIPSYSKKIHNFNQPKIGQDIVNKENENNLNINANIPLNLNNELNKENSENKEKIENINEDFKKEPENEVKNLESNENNENQNGDNELNIKTNQNLEEQNEIDKSIKEGVITKEKNTNDINVDLNVDINGNIGTGINNIIENNIGSNFNVNVNEQHEEKYSNNDIDTNKLVLLDDKLKYSSNEQNEQKINFEIGESLIPNPELLLRQKQNKINNGINININNPNIESEIKGIEGNQKPEFNVEINKNITGEVQIPEINGPNINVEGPIISTNPPNIDINPPEISGTNINIEQPNININPQEIIGSKVNIEPPNININSPEIKGSKVNIEPPNININPPGIKGESNYPNLSVNNYSQKMEISKPEIKVSGTENEQINIDLKRPGITGDLGLDIKTEVKEGYDFYASGIILGINPPNIPETNLKNPKIEVNAPKIETNGNIGGNLNVPDPSLKVSGPGIGVSGTQMNINNTQNINIEGPKVDVNPPKVDANINSQGPHINNDKNIDADLAIDLKNKYDFYLEGLIMGYNDKENKSINLQGNIPNQPEINIQGNMPNVTVNNPTGNANIDMNLNNPNINVQGISTNLKGPSVNLNAPSANINTANLNNDINISTNIPNIQEPKMNLKFPNMSQKNINGPKLEINNNLQGISFQNPNVELPSSNVDIKGKGINLGEINATGPKTSINLPGNNIDANIKPPEVNAHIPNMDIKGPQINISGPQVKGETDIKYDFYETGIIYGENDPNVKNNANVNVNLPSANVNLNDNMSGVNINAPKLDINGNITGGNLNVPKVDMNMQNQNIGGNININGPKIEIPSPNIKINNEASNNFKEPNFDINLKGSNSIKIPNINITDPNVGGNFNNQTKFLSNVDTPQANINIEGGNVNVQNKIPEGYDYYECGTIKGESSNENMQLNKNNNNNENNNILTLKNQNNLNNNNGTGGGYGINVNLGGNGTQLNNNNWGLNIGDVGDKVQNTLKINEYNMQKKKNILPTISQKNSEFITSKVDEAGKLDEININTNNLVSVNVGIGGQKMGDRVDN